MSKAFRVSTGTIVVISGLLAAAGGLTGCHGHGTYTNEGIDQAELRMSQLKSGTEWQQAQQQYLAGDLKKALKSVDRSLALKEDVAKSHVLRGRILIEMGQLEEAQESLVRAEELEAENVDAQYYLGVVYERLNEPELARERYLKAASIDEGNAQYIVAAAEMSIQEGDLVGAKQLLESRQGEFQYNAAVRQSLGQIALLQNDFSGAINYLTEAQRLAPDDQAILEDLVRAEIGAGKFAEAEFNIGKLLAMPENADRRDLKHMRARCLVAIGRPLEARTVLLGLTSDAEGVKDIRAWTELGNVACTLNDRVNLRQAAGRLIALTPDSSEGYLFRTMQYRIEGYPDKALETVNTAISRAPGQPSPLVLKGLILQDLNRPEEAVAVLTEAYQLNPQDESVRRLMIAMQNSTIIATEHTLPQGTSVTSEPSAAE